MNMAPFQSAWGSRKADVFARLWLGIAATARHRGGVRRARTLTVTSGRVRWWWEWTDCQARLHLPVHPAFRLPSRGAARYCACSGNQ